ncbi:uncharacterized protein LOC143019561 [Oratosquilla oratoria]|uniref:uncharacterized protein LOC143019561 n=1 Tax=Oratosquilla oratoria TaxID=337810 RepID=UPI003F7671B9
MVYTLSTVKQNDTLMWLHMYNCLSHHFLLHNTCHRPKLVSPATSPGGHSPEVIISAFMTRHARIIFSVLFEQDHGHLLRCSCAFVCLFGGRVVVADPKVADLVLSQLEGPDIEWVSE